MKAHLGAGFDVRFVKLGSRSATDTLPSAKRTQMWNISVGDLDSVVLLESQCWAGVVQR